VIEPTRALRPQIYLPFGLWRWAPLSFTVRTENDPRAAIPAARAVVREIGNGLPISRVQVLSDSLEAATAVLRTVTGLVVALALSAALLTCLGLYAFVSYLVVHERRVAAIRLVLGASPDSLLRAQLGRILLILTCSLPVGVVLCVTGARLLDSLVYGVAAVDAGSLAVAAALGALLGLAAAYIPARQAVATDPTVLLRVG
jgi:ABC-type antimicrobial peptide transport system permease subunit